MYLFQNLVRRDSGMGVRTLDAVGEDSNRDLTKALGSYLLKLTISANIVAPMARQCFHANSSRLLELCCCSPSLKSNKNHSVSTVVNLKDKLFKSFLSL